MGRQRRRVEPDQEGPVDLHRPVQGHGPGRDLDLRARDVVLREVREGGQALPQRHIPGVRATGRRPAANPARALLGDRPPR
jgi:hypothetical protein